MSCPSELLIWNKDVGFIRINEGDGSNLFDEDQDDGYVDYIMLDYMEYDGCELTENDGVQWMLTEMYQAKYHSPQDVIKDAIDCGWIPDVEYTILYESKVRE